jgi:HEAT repeat protein
MSKTPTQIKSLARSHTETAINVLVGIMNKESAPESSRVTAAEALLSRGWGKPSQAIDGDGDGGPIELKVTWQNSGS